jgi:hypothetical protein
MTRRKNALRIHELAPYTAPTDGGEPTVPAEDAWLRFAKRITSISDDSEESTESEGDYAGDGTEEDVLTGRSEKWKYEGTYDPTDPAQKLIKDLKRKTNDDDRLIWHRIHESDGTVVTGVAKVLDIVAGGGDATDYEDFTGSINFIKTPTESKETP